MNNVAIILDIISVFFFASVFCVYFIGRIKLQIYDPLLLTII